MKKNIPKLNKLYRLILSNRDWISFLSGIVVSGYVVRISLNADNSLYHWFTIFCGLFFGFFSFMLVKVCKNFDFQFTINKKNNPKLHDEENSNDSWQLVNRDLDSNKVWGKLPKFWIKLITPSLIISLIVGIIAFNIGNERNYTDYEIKKTNERNELLESIDSLNDQNLKGLEVENKIFHDSTKASLQEVHRQLERLDSIEIQIRLLKDN